MIEIQGIYKKYKKEYIYENFSLSFPEGQVTVLLGPSGCGKTTLLRMLAGLESYEKGTISGLSGKRISFVFQEDRLLPWLTVSENLELVLRAFLTTDQAKERVTQVLTLLNIPETRSMMPEELSGGMQRRVAIGRALAYDGDIMILDEPFKGMDEALKNEVLPKLAKSWEESGKTVILVTHDLSDARKLSHSIYELSGKPVKCRIKSNIEG
jgi:ABC-type nitrate/sulfonate/bicarbonate transport system, ATPase component